MRTRMRQLSNAEAERIFESYGPLYELGPKADMAYALELIDGETLASLRALKNIRNAFAHTKTPLHFKSPVIDKKCQALPGWNEGIDNRDLFDRIARECIDKIDGQIMQLMFSSPDRP
jgi:hypothetical protein